MTHTKKALVTKLKKLSLAAPKMRKGPVCSYNEDFYEWTRMQVTALKNQEFSKLDIAHLIEEIESLGNSEMRALESYMMMLFLHLLKIEYQPAMRCKLWENSVENAKFRIKKLIKENPSLKSKIAEFIPDAYFSAKLGASSETGLDTKAFPAKCPWEPKNILS